MPLMFSSIELREMRFVRIDRAIADRNFISEMLCFRIADHTDKSFSSRKERFADNIEIIEGRFAGSPFERVEMT